MKCPKCKTPGLEVNQHYGIPLVWEVDGKKVNRVKCVKCGEFEIERNKFRMLSKKERG